MVTARFPNKKRGARFLGGTALFLALALALGWVLLHPWRAMDLPGPREVEVLGEKEPLPDALLGEGPVSSSRRSLPAGKKRDNPEVRSLEILVKDALSRLPLEGVSLLEFGKPPRLLGRTDRTGRALLPSGFPLTRLLVRKSGYLGLFLGLSTPFFRGLRARLEKGDGALALPPDPVTRSLEGMVAARNGSPGTGVKVTLLVLDPADPLHPPGGVPPGLAGSWRVALAAESLCRGAPVREPWELGAWGARVVTRAGKDGRFRFRVFSRGRALLQCEDGKGNTVRTAFRLPAAAPLALRMSEGSWIQVGARPGGHPFSGSREGGGRFQITCRDGWSIHGKEGRRAGPFLPGESLHVSFSLGGTPLGESLLQAPPAGVTRAVAFPSLAGFLVWRARVVEKASRRPLSGVAVRLSGGGEARTAGDGSFRLFLPGEGSRLVTFRGEGFQERTLVVDPARPLPSLVELLPSSGGEQVSKGLLAKVEGTVVDDAGEPVTSARVVAARLDRPDPNRPAPKGIFSTGTDPGGRFRLLLPVPGRYRLRAFHPSAGTAFREITTTSGDRIEVEMVLVRPLQLRGRVVDGATGLPVEGARVLLSRPGLPSCQARTGGDGSFLLKPWTPGKWTLQVFGPQGRRKTRILDLPPGGGEEVQVVLGS